MRKAKHALTIGLLDYGFRWVLRYQTASGSPRSTAVADLQPPSWPSPASVDAGWSLRGLRRDGPRKLGRHFYHRRIRWGGLVCLIAAHRSEKVLCMLIAVLCFNDVAVQSR